MIYIYLYIHIVVSMPGLHIQCVPLTFLEKFVAAASHVFMFFFFLMHICGTWVHLKWMGKVVLHITGSEAWLKLPAPKMRMPLNSRISHLVHPGYCGESIVSKVDSQKG